jgi:MFS family permease
MVFFIDAATFLISASMIIPIALPAAAGVTRAGFVRGALADIRAGILYTARQPTLASLTVLTVTAVVLATMIYPLLVVLAYRLERGGLPETEAYSVLLVAVAAGALAGAVAAPRVVARWRAGVAILVGIFGMGLGIAIVGTSSLLWVAAFGLLVSGFTNTLYYIPAITATQEASEDAYRGRVMAGRSTVIQVGFLVGLTAGAILSGVVGVSQVFVISGTLLMVAALLAAVVPAIRNLRGEPPAAAPELRADPIAAVR